MLKLTLVATFSLFLISCGSNNAIPLVDNSGNLASQNDTGTNQNNNSGGNANNSGNTGSSGSVGNASGSTLPAKLDFNRPFEIVEDYGFGFNGSYSSFSDFYNRHSQFTNCIYGKRQGDTIGTSSTYMQMGFGPCLHITFRQN